MLRVLLTLGLLAAPAWALAQEDGWIDYRQNLMGAIGMDMAAIGTVMKHQLPVGENIAGHAAAIETHSAQIASAFTQRVTAGKTDAEPEIWDDPEGFAEALAAFQEQATKFAATARAGDMRATGGAMQALGKSCNGCHEGYRKPKEESYKNQ